MRPTPILIGAAAAILLAGCGGSSKSATASSATPTSSGSSSSAGSAGSSAGTSPSSSSSDSTATGPLSKADFVAKTNNVCLDETSKLNAIPTPSGLTDYPTIVTNLNSTLAEFKNYLQRVEAIVPQSADAAQLKAKWIEPEEAELTKVEAVIGRMVADAQAKDATKIQTDAADLEKASASASTIASYLNTYGLTDCASLESS